MAYKPIPQLSEQRKKDFHKKVNRISGDGCWLWQMKPCTGGYGMFSINGDSFFAHRVAWMLHTGKDPIGWHVCHHCDTPLCVRPDHLFLGTDKTNLQDMARKGRQVFQKHPEKVARGEGHWTKFKPELMSRGDAHYSRTNPERLARGDRHGSRTKPENIKRGERHGMAKLTVAQVLQIRKEWAERKEPQTVIGARYGIDQCTVSAIGTRYLWGHIPDEISIARKQPEDDES